MRIWRRLRFLGITGFFLGIPLIMAYILDAETGLFPIEN